MSSERSPGPWEHRQIHTDTYAGEERVVHVERYIRDANGGRICVLTDHVEALANARLISAAPDLLEALTLAVRYWNAGPVAREEAVKIAKGALSRAGREYRDE